MTNTDIHPPTINPEQSVIVTGNPVDGLSFIGPFDTPNDAIDFADRTNGGQFDGDWWVAKLTSAQFDADGNWIAPIRRRADWMDHQPVGVLVEAPVTYVRHNADTGKRFAYVMNGNAASEVNSLAQHILAELDNLRDGKGDPLAAIEAIANTLIEIAGPV